MTQPPAPPDTPLSPLRNRSLELLRGAEPGAARGGSRSLLTGRPRLVALALAVAGALLLLAWLAFGLGPGPLPIQRARHVVSRQALQGRLREMGKVVARTETLVLSPFSGEVAWKIEEGTLVQPGEVVVRFDDTAEREKFEDLKQTLFDREQAVLEARSQLDETVRRNRLLISKQEAALEMARIEQAVVLALPMEKDRQFADLDLKGAQLRYTQTQKAYEDNQELFKAGFLTEALLKQKKLEMVRQKAEVAKQQVLRDLLLMGASNDSRRLAELRVKEARKSLESARFNQEADLAIARANLELNEVSLENFKLEMENRRRYLEDAAVKAMVPGRVAFVDVWKGSRQAMSPVQIGESRNRGQDLCKIADTSVLRVRILVNEADLGRLFVGQAAQIRMSALPQRLFQAQVSQIALVVQDKNVALDRLALMRSGEAFVNVVEVYLDFKSLPAADRDAIRLGFTAEVLLSGPETSKALLVPQAALTFEGGQPFVERVAADGRVERVAVTLGASDEDSVEVGAGLAEGEVVLLPPAAPGAPAAGPGGAP